jgi:Rieske Fe-S protein
MGDTDLSRRAFVAAAVALGAVGCTTYGKQPTQPTAGSGLQAKTADIEVGGGKVFADQQVVVTQPESDSFKAFTAVCTHQGCTVANVSGGTINCECHGSKYKITDGSVLEGPAPSPLAAKTVTASGDAITVT